MGKSQGSTDNQIGQLASISYWHAMSQNAMTLQKKSSQTLTKGIATNMGNSHDSYVCILQLSLLTPDLVL